MKAAFFDLMRDWYVTNAGRDVTTLDFQDHLEKHIGVDMSWFIDQWIYGTDLPTYLFSYELEQNQEGNYLAHCRVEQQDVPPDFKMYVPLDIEFEGDSHYYLRVLVDAPVVEFDLPPLATKPKKIKLNPFESVLARVKGN